MNFPAVLAAPGRSADLVSRPSFAPRSHHAYAKRPAGIRSSTIQAFQWRARIGDPARDEMGSLAPGSGTRTMIGKVVFQYKSKAVEAVMDDDGFWHCDAIPCLARPLNILYSASFYRAPADASRSLHDLRSAAVWLRGEVCTEGN
jgi:hypothetical protein